MPPLRFGDPTSIGIARRARLVAKLLEAECVWTPEGEPHVSLLLREAYCDECDGLGVIELGDDDDGWWSESCDECDGDGYEWHSIWMTIAHATARLQSMDPGEFRELCLRHEIDPPNDVGLSFCLIY